MEASDPGKNQQNKEVLKSFYAGMAGWDAVAMGNCYHEKAEFIDPAFGRLDAQGVRKMWALLLERAKGDLEISYEIVEVEENHARVKLLASYHFGPQKRPVNNNIHSHFQFQDGLIIQQVDHFSFWRWSRMALGLSGLLLGWTPWLKKKVQRRSRALLNK